MLKTDFPVREENKIHVPLFAGYSNLLAISEKEARDPAKAFLGQNNPNPFVHESEIEYAVATPGYVSLELYRADGSLLRSLWSGYREPGTYTLHVNVREGNSGTLFCRLRTSGDDLVVPMLCIQ